LVGWFIDLADQTYQFIPSTFVAKASVFTIGLLMMTFGRSLYIASRLGPGPRDGLFVGLSRTLKIQVKYMKPAIELTVLLLGFIFGGTAGVGTVIAAVFSGYLVQMFFTLLAYDPVLRSESNIVRYFQTKSSSNN